MRFTLKTYQEDAVQDVLGRLDQAKEMYRGKHQATSSFSLTAVTGAGKTVMAAAVIESLFEGNDDYEFEADPGAVVLWFTDDPSLNEQTRFRLMEASDLAFSRMKVIEPDFSEEKLRPGRVYFLNSQKLSKNSRLVRGVDLSDDPALPGMKPAPDLRGSTMWEILRNTIEDEKLTLYLILDEAHKGMRKPTTRDRNEKQTIVRRLINGEAGAPAVPIVWGISATVQRFEEAMAEAESGGRVRLPPVVVDAARVQESGLLKDDIRLDFPKEKGQFDTVLLSRAVRRTCEAEEKWTAYAASQDPPLEPVVPLLVVQLPNTPSDELLATAFQTVSDAWPELPDDAMAHVFGDHRLLEAGGHTVPHIAPEKVQDSTWVRVLFAKDAISTGWDCPRAEVLMSFRPAQDETHITQLLGRMVRTPLAARVPGDDRLNAVECVLPHFNRDTATRVGDLLLGRKGEEAGESGGGEGRRTLFAPVDLTPNESIPEYVWEAFDRLPSQTLPKKVARPTKRLLAYAQALSRDGLRAGARAEAIREMCAVLDGFSARYKAKVATAANDVRELTGETVVAGLNARDEFDIETFTEVADDRAIAADFAAAGRVLTKELAGAYVRHLVDEADPDDPDEALLDAEVQVAALAKVPGVGVALDLEADGLAEQWIAEYRVARIGLSDERRAIHEEIIGMSTQPKEIDILRPRVRSESTEDEHGVVVETRLRHLMSDPLGAFPIGSLNDWETRVLETEMARPGFVGWYRNPSRPSADAFAVPYRKASGEWHRMCPDFIFFHGGPSDVKVSIVDPHGLHLEDAMPKLRGLAALAEAYPSHFQRIDAVAMVGGKLRVLDMLDAAVRAVVGSATDAEALYLKRGTNYA